MTRTIAARASVSTDWWRGRIVTQYEADWTWVALAFDDGTTLVLSVDEVNVGHWFEVFPLKFDSSLPDYLVGRPFKWITLAVPLDVQCVHQLWRAEWQEPVQDHGQFLGAGPHSVQYAGPLQSAPSYAVAFQVEAGIALQDSNGRRLFVCSSDDTPFKIDFATDPADIEKILQSHTVQSLA